MSSPVAPAQSVPIDRAAFDEFDPTFAVSSIEIRRSVEQLRASLAELSATQSKRPQLQILSDDLLASIKAAAAEITNSTDDDITPVITPKASSALSSAAMLRDDAIALWDGEEKSNVLQ